MEEEGSVPHGTAALLRSKKLALVPERIEEIERTTKHDVIAFLAHVEELAGAEARWLHRGMTSSDVLDSSLAMLLREAAERLLARTDRLLAALAARAREHAKTPMMGRSHGIYAEPVTFGLVLAGHHAEICRGHRRLAVARREISVGKIAGAVGTYAHLSPELELRTLQRLGLEPETVATQVVARDRHAAYFVALALLAAGIERLAMLLDNPPKPPAPVAVVPIGEAAEAAALGILQSLRGAGVRAEMAYRGNLRRRMERANRIGARAAVILGEDDLAQGVVQVKNLATGEQEAVALADVAARLG